MADDPYATLGVARDATADDLRRAYRALAKKHHPDLNPGDASAETRFKAINAANDLLSDPDKRARFDRHEIDAAGDPVAPEPPRYRSYADSGAANTRYRRSAGAPGDEADLNDIFGDFFRRQSGASADGEAFRMRGQNARYTLPVEFLDAITGATRTLTLPEGADTTARTLDVRIPPGIADGQTLRLRGQGAPGINGGPPGDALIEVRVYPHPFFTRDNRDVLLDLPVTLKEAVLGARIAVPTATGPVTMTIPPRSGAGTRLRLRARGVPATGDAPAGDQYVTLRLTAADADDALAAFLQSWTSTNPTNPRAEMDRP